MTRCDGYDNWWQVTTDALNAANTPEFRFRMDDGINAWNFEPKETYMEVDTDYLQIINDDYANNLQAIADCDNQVLYIECGKWATPCNTNKAGRAIITANVPKVPEGYTVGLVGSFEEGYWDIYDGVRQLTKTEEGVYVLETEIPAGFEFIILLSADGINWSWDIRQVNENFIMDLDLEVTVAVDSWKGL